MSEAEAQVVAVTDINGNAVEAESTTIPVTDLDDFVNRLIDWHDLQVATLKHIMQMPAGSEIVVAGDTPETSQALKMDGDVLIAFQLGIDLALGHLGTLPFVPEYEDKEAEPV